jgi:hypothetical protein
MEYAVNLNFHRECIRRIGWVKKKDKKSDICICSMHPIVEIVKDVEWEDNKGETNVIRHVVLHVPSNDGVATINNNTLSQQQLQTSIREIKGSAIDRAINRMLLSTMEDNQASIILTQILENQEGNIEDINPAVARTAGINNNPKPTKIIVIMPKSLQYEDDNKTAVRFCDLSNKMIKITTGFPSIALMLNFIIIINNGDIIEVQKNCYLPNMDGGMAIIF